MEAGDVKEAEEVARSMSAGLNINAGRLKCVEIDPIIGGIIMLSRIMIENVGPGKERVYMESSKDIGNKSVCVYVFIHDVKRRRKSKLFAKLLAEDILRRVTDIVFQHVSKLPSHWESLDIYIRISFGYINVTMCLDGDKWDVCTLMSHEDKEDGTIDEWASVSTTIGKIGMGPRRKYVENRELSVSDKITSDMFTDMYKRIEVKPINIDEFELFANLFIKILKGIAEFGFEAYNIIAMYTLYP